MVTASIGVAVFPEHGTTASRLLRSADDALYVAKEAGRNCWRFAVEPGAVTQDAGVADDAAISLGAATTDGIGADEAAVRAFDETSPLANPENEPNSQHETGDPRVTEPDAEPDGRPGQGAQVDLARPHVVVVPDATVPGATVPGAAVPGAAVPGATVPRPGQPQVPRPPDR